MKIDPRRLASIEIQLDAITDEIAALGEPEISDALAQTRESIKRVQDLLDARHLHLQIPHDYKPPRRVRGKAKTT